jgi:hypothetical protein
MDGMQFTLQSPIAGKSNVAYLQADRRRKT